MINYIILSRLIALTCLLTSIQLFSRIKYYSSRKGIKPLYMIFEAIRRDYSSYYKYFYFPSIFWLSTTDIFQNIIVLITTISSILWFLGGEYTHYYIFCVYILLTSLNQALALKFPWDCFLSECVFFSLFLPTIPHINNHNNYIINQVDDAVLFAFRWLCFRLMFGFGKQKFIGHTWKDMGYLKGFYISIPMPNIIGYYLNRYAPMWFHVLSLISMFIIEIIVPFLFLSTSETLRFIAVILTVILQIAIILTGNFGVFNVIASIASCFALISPTNESIFPLYALFKSPILLFHTILSLIALLFNSWCDGCFHHWSTLIKIPLMSIYRAFAPLNILHAYGVFPPGSAFGQRFFPVFEGSDDGKNWKVYEYYDAPSNENSAPLPQAPFHRRFDFEMFYRGLGVLDENFISAGFTLVDPFEFSTVTKLDRIVYQLLRPDSHEWPIAKCFYYNPFLERQSPPKYVRVLTYRFSTPSLKQKNIWWKKEFVHVHCKAKQYNDVKHYYDPDSVCPHISLAHPDAMHWRHRSKYFNHLYSRKNIPQYKKLFIFMDEISQKNWTHFKQLPAALKWFNVRYNDESKKLLLLKQIGSMTGLLLKVCEPHFCGLLKPRIPAKSYFHLTLLSHALLFYGRDEFLNAMASCKIGKPSQKVINLLKCINEDPGHAMLLFGLFRFEKLALQCRKLRLIKCATFGRNWKNETLPFENEPVVPGFFNILSWLTTTGHDIMQLSMKKPLPECLPDQVIRKGFDWIDLSLIENNKFN